MASESVSSVERMSNLLFIDTAGANQPVTKDEVDNRAASEYFLQKLVLHLSDAVLIVLDALTLRDQRYIQNLQEAIDRGGMFGDILFIWRWEENRVDGHRLRSSAKRPDPEPTVHAQLVAV
eukprot:CAMPEP_0170170304 /NCGR_PEP_ID=MMETSP0040_2-20121228/3286_1 /TAXON_ID=641309 /ORGANISM="Lotharella oceanica, Strain CCMP622" /LENGTH=120 /DNA_ID=CAMNT_0010409621 /DNA_START=261 /DNA_END=623 /DNA_ORIENTATION=+